MEHTSTEPSSSPSYVESTGDSEVNTIPGTAVSLLCITTTNTSTDDDDAESTSGDFVDAKNEDEADDKDRMRSPVEGSSKNVNEESTNARLTDKEERDDKEEAQEAVAVVETQGDAESDRRFWDACIAHGY